MTTPLPAGTGARLYAGLVAADDAITALWAEYHEWDDQGRTGPFPRDFWDRLHQAQAERQEIADRVWAYFEGPECTVLEAVAWRLWDIGKQHTRAQGQP